MKTLRIVLIALTAFFIFTNQSSVHAAFNKNNIIIDSVFDDYGTMTKKEIQNFLDTFPNGCLADFEARYPIGYDEYGEKVSAATVIRRAADIYKVNPQVILATLQKESSLVTGNDGCASWRYNSAMGMACPDGGQCPAPGYEGFSKQVTKGSWLLRFGKERANGNVNWEANDGVGGDFNVSYSGPMTEGCHKRNIDDPVVCYDGLTTIDGESVYITTGATGSFYNYTPHLHGNQLFVSIFEGWFGPTTPSYRSKTYYRYKHQSAFRGETVTAEAWFKNVGSVAWYDAAGLEDAPAGTRKVMLYTSHPVGHENLLGSQWGSNKNVPGRYFTAVYESDGETLATNQHVVEPGQIAKYDITFVVPKDANYGRYRSFFQPSLFQKPNTFNDPWAFLDVNVVKRNYKAETYHRYRHQSALPGETVDAQMWFKNTGNVPWYDPIGLNEAPAGTNKVMLYTSHDVGRKSILGSQWGSNKNVPGRYFTAVYESDGETLATNQHVVEPGQIARYDFSFVVPMNAKSGRYREFFQPSLFRHPKAFNDPWSFLDVNVQPLVYESETFYRCCHQTANQGEIVTAEAWFKNTGNVPWYDPASLNEAPAGSEKVMLYTSHPLGFQSPLGDFWTGNTTAGRYFTEVYKSNGTELAAKQHVVQPGQIAKYEIAFKVPEDLDPGKYRTFFQPSLFRHPDEFNDPWAFLDVNVVNSG